MTGKVEHHLGIRAPAAVIWRVIADISRWEAWNPLYPRARGELRIGSRLELEESLPGRPPRSLQPLIVDWVPNEQVIWRVSRLAGMLRSTRYIEIEALTETGCIFSNGELLEGFFEPFVSARRRRAMRAGFASMGEAVKTRVEADWRPGAGVPT